MGFTGQYIRLPPFVSVVSFHESSQETCFYTDMRVEFTERTIGKEFNRGPASDSLWDDHDVLHLSNVAVTILSFAALSSTWPGKLNGRKRNVSIRFHTDDGGTRERHFQGVQ